jgi:hypothetical protein
MGDGWVSPIKHFPWLSDSLCTAYLHTHSRNYPQPIEGDRNTPDDALWPPLSAKRGGQTTLSPRGWFDNSLWSFWGWSNQTNHCHTYLRHHFFVFDIAIQF